MSFITKTNATARADSNGPGTPSRFIQAILAQFTLKEIFICRLSFKNSKKKKKAIKFNAGRVH
jgi:hypothetical protein